VIAIGVLIAGLAAIGSVKTTWSFSAFTVLVYYAITNLAALAMPKELRLFPRWIAAAGLGCCLFLAFWVEPAVLARRVGARRGGFRLAMGVAQVRRAGRVSG
jgi:APA family basic amino acid/polyamine antiporter